MNLEQIDTSTTAGKAEVMRLAAEGRKVFSTRRKDGGGVGPVDPPWNWQDFDYAIIAEPVGPEEVWVAFSKDGEVATARCMEADADRVMRRIGHCGQSVRYIRADLAGEKG
ncbi:hypothetical protein J5H43_01820 [Stenotrophomonas maltophilia]|uniref:hypothetical protein n=1 Tax=Stenotrophomonas maltophilia TaxID=40324 RepID=UPI001AAFDBC8|nr:hypothetical protein [Stenotrophomonas maltophilia]MBO3002251.1 hypothetical protein [Stenotrophomonas maltophilia]MBP1381605.1 hypothetical protein [Stenotrophomonas maltophilia]MBP1386617.1 hypothetical protein [Stenotrophomonas maltophilia]